MFVDIEYGTRIKVGNDRMIIDEVDESNRIITFKTQARRKLSLSFIEFSKKYEKGEVVFIDSDEPEDLKNEFNLRKKLSGYSVQEVDKAYENYEWIKSCLDENGKWISNTDERLYRQKEYALTIGLKDRKKSDRQIRRLYFRWKACNKDIISLIPKYKKRGNRVSRISNEQEKIIERFIYEIYMNDKRPTVSYVYKYINRAIENNPEYKDIEKISRSTIERRIKNIPEYERSLKRDGWKAAQRNFPYGAPLNEPEYLNQRCEIDHTPMDVKVICDDTGEVLGRPWLTVIQEYKSKMIVGYYLGMNNPNAFSVLSAIRNAILQKGDLIESNDELDGFEWPCRGLMSELVMDNGSDLTSDKVKYGLAQLNITAHYNPKARPNYKGSVERFFKTTNEQVTQFLPGKTFSNYLFKGDYQPDKNAKITFQELKKKFETWVVTEYHQNNHRGLGDSPINVWKKLEIEAPAIRMPDSIDQVNKLFWDKCDRPIHKYGIEVHSRKYNSPELQEVAKLFGRKKKADIYTDPKDSTNIKVCIPDSDDILTVYAVDNEYARLNLSLATHNRVVSHAKKIKGIRCGKSLSEMDLISAYHDLMRIQDEDRISKIKRRRVKEAKRRSQEIHKTDASNIEDEELSVECDFWDITDEDGGLEVE